MVVRYTNKGRVMRYTKGASKEDVMSFLSSRIAKRQKEIDKREWIVREYNSLIKKQEEDKSWLIWTQHHFDEGDEDVT